VELDRHSWGISPVELAARPAGAASPSKDAGEGP
jgi:hypothetical protein